MADAPGEEEPKKRPSPPPVEFLKREEQGPLPPREQMPAAWVPRPEDYQRPSSWMPPPAAGAPRAPSNLPKIAGVLLILSAVVGMAGAVYNAVTLPSVAEYANYTRNNSAATVALLQICGVVSIWSQGLAFLGGVMAFQRLNWRLTLVCALFSLATLGFFLFEASLIGLLGLLVTIRARPYFLT
jgi:hypothetical protein